MNNYAKTQYAMCNGMKYILRHSVEQVICAKYRFGIYVNLNLYLLVCITTLFQMSVLK